VPFRFAAAAPFFPPVPSVFDAVSSVFPVPFSQCPFKIQNTAFSGKNQPLFVEAEAGFRENRRGGVFPESAAGRPRRLFSHETPP
jgi:hypothetical protein